MAIRYNEKTEKEFNISEQDFNRVSKDVYDNLVNEYTDTEDLDYLLYISNSQ